MGAETVALIAASGSVAAAFFAGYQIYLSVLLQRRTSTFQHLRDIDRRLQRVWVIKVPEVVTEIEQAYSSGAEGLSEGASHYMSLLNALDLLALEIEQDAVEKRIAEDFLRSICRKGFIGSRLIRTIQIGWQDKGIYKYLLHHLDHFESLEEGDGYANSSS